MISKNFIFANLFFMQLLQISNGSSAHMVRVGLTLQAAWEQIHETCPQLVNKATKSKYLSRIAPLLAPIYRVTDPNHGSYLKAAGQPTQAEIDKEVAAFCKLEEFEIPKLRDGEGVVKKVSDYLPELSSDDALPELSLDADLHDRGQGEFSIDSNSNFRFFSYILFLFGLVCGSLVTFCYFTCFPLSENSKIKMNLRRPEL